MCLYLKCYNNKTVVLPNIKLFYRVRIIQAQTTHPTAAVTANTEEKVQIKLCNLIWRFDSVSLLKKMAKKEQEGLYPRKMTEMVNSYNIILNNVMHTFSRNDSHVDDILNELCSSAMKIIKNYHDMLNYSEVLTRNELEHLWKTKHRSTDVAKMIGYLLDSEEEWNSLLKQADEMLKSNSVSGTSFKNPDMQSVISTDLINCNTGRTTSLETHICTENLQKIIIVFMRHYG